MVRLKDRKFHIKYDPYDNFNSTMVRLKGGWLVNAYTSELISIPLWFG